MNTYDRYSKFRENGTIKIVPFIKISPKESDIIVTYERGVTRLDILSYKYYYNSNYGWLILQANPQYGSMEFLIPDKAELRIPYPLDLTLKQYNTDIDTYMKVNGLD